MPTYTTVTNSTAQADAIRQMHQVDITFATPADDYPTGGYTTLALQNRVGQGRTIRKVDPESFVTASGAWDGRHWRFNRVTGNLQAWGENSAEIANGTNVSATTVRLWTETD